MSDQKSSPADEGEDFSIIHGTGNTFADLGLPRAAERHAKNQLALSIREIIESSGMTQRDAAKKAGIAASDLSNIMRGRVTNFSSDRLFAVLNALGNDVEITIRPNQAARGSVFVSTSTAPLVSVAKTHSQSA